MAAQVSALQAQEMRLRRKSRTGHSLYRPRPILSLQAAIFGQRQADYNSRLESYRHKIDSLSARPPSVCAPDIASYKSRVEYAQEAVNVRKELEQLKLGSKLNSLQALDLPAEAQRNLASTEHAAAAAQQDLAALVAERNSFVQSWHSQAAEKLADVVSKLSDAREALSKAQLRNQLVELRAPRDATVMSVSKISVGSVVSPETDYKSRFQPRRHWKSKPTSPVRRMATCRSVIPSLSSSTPSLTYCTAWHMVSYARSVRTAYLARRAAQSDRHGAAACKCLVCHRRLVPVADHAGPGRSARLAIKFPSGSRHAGCCGHSGWQANRPPIPDRAGGAPVY